MNFFTPFFFCESVTDQEHRVAESNVLLVANAISIGQRPSATAMDLTFIMQVDV